MNYKFIFFIFFIFLFSCKNQSSKIDNQSSIIKYTKIDNQSSKIDNQPSIIKYTNYFKFYSNKGFTLVYTDKLLKNKIVNRKIDKRSLIVFNNNLKKDTPVKITNLLNGKYLIAKIGNKSKYPTFYNSVISDRIANDLNIDLSEPYVQIQTINSKNSFIANKAITFDEEKRVANKAPVENISIKSISHSKELNKKSNVKKINNFNYIIKFADLFFEDSAVMLINRLLDEFNINNVKIKKLSKNNYRVYKGPFNSLESIKKEFIDIDNLDFENIEIIKL
tara:strand:- start:19 stop:852 length:834 start_codon:yes stop_codon:yes gene_type:complete